MNQQLVSDNEEILIKANVEVCFERDQLKQKVVELQDKLVVALSYNDYICALARKMSPKAKVIQLKVVS